MKQHLTLNSNNNFIKGWYINNLDLCDSVVSYFETNDCKFKGQSSHGVDISVKDSTDCYLEDSYLLNLYVEQLVLISQEYINLFPYVDHYSPWGIVEGINVQKYNPSQAYHAWHTERAHAVYPQTTRHLAFMTYLNDVTDQGETEFYHQNIKVKPEKGLTLIWPADWTHTHRGLSSNTQVKYIVTGWFNYFDNNLQ